MNANTSIKYKLIEGPKVMSFKIFLLRFWYHILLICLLFVSLVYYIVVKHSNKSSIHPAEHSHLDFKSFEDCLKSVGVDGNNVIRRSNGTRYKEINWQWNTVNGYLEPLAYLSASDVSDVQKAVFCCQLLNIRVVPRSGGHSLLKYSFADSNSIVIDLKKLNQISLDRIHRRCDIGPGALAGFISYTLWKEGEFMVPVGICPTVGLGGLTAGGGYGYYTRLLGLTSDNLIELEMVDSKGNLLLINSSMNKDLFWALRGGGGGSFGIVTKLTFKMHSAPKSITYGVFAYRFDDFSQFYKSWQSLITSGLPNNIGTLTKMYNSTIEMEIFKFHSKDADEEYSDFQSLLSSFSFPTPTVSRSKLLSYPEFMLITAQPYTRTPLNHLSQLANITRHCMVGMLKVKSIYVDVSLDKDEISKLQVLLSAHLKLGFLYFEQNLGAINDLNCSETAFIHRGTNLFHIQLSVHSNENERINLEAISAMNTFFEESKAVLKHRQSYQNYLDSDIPDYLERYYGANLRKLIQVKMKIDPENIFHHPQSIPANFV